MTAREIAAILNETVTPIYYILKHNNIKRRLSGPRKPILPENIISEYKNTPNATVDMFAKKYKCDNKYMKDFLRKGISNLYVFDRSGVRGLTDKQKQNIYRDFKNNNSITTIKKKYKKSYYTIKNIINHYGKIS
jgi:2,3-bisphosphoglycerate-independent phosphoglycerate mutase